MIIRPYGVLEPAQAQFLLARTEFEQQPDWRCGCCGDRRGVAVRFHSILRWPHCCGCDLQWFRRITHCRTMIKIIRPFGMCAPAQAQFHFAKISLVWQCRQRPRSQVSRVRTSVVPTAERARHGDRCVEQGFRRRRCDLHFRGLVVRSSRARACVCATARPPHDDQKQLLLYALFLSFLFCVIDLSICLIRCSSV